eukprot:4248966-Alexandrium_andersonii.AAC.1
MASSMMTEACPVMRPSARGLARECGGVVPDKPLEGWPGIPGGREGKNCLILRWEMAIFLAGQPQE